jgi:rubrerythrin
MRYREFILEDFKTAKAAFVGQGADPAEVDSVIANYRALNKKNQFQDNEKNIDWWAKQGWDLFKQRVNIVAQTPTKTAVKRSKIEGRAIELVSSNPEWEIYIPLDKQASCNIGTGTDWCTTKQNQTYFESYFYDRGITLVYLIGTKTKFAIAMHEKVDQMEFFTKTDQSISKQQFEQSTGLSVDDIRAQVKQHQPQIQKAREEAIVKDPNRALAYALRIGTPFPEGEPAIASTARTAFDYANKVLKDRFPMGEITILRAAKDANPPAAGDTVGGISIAVGYAKHVIKDRWPEFEKIISNLSNEEIKKLPGTAGYDLFYYTKELIKGPWPAVEPIMTTEDSVALNYAVKVLKGRFPAYEPKALRTARTAWMYIEHVLKQPWPEAEPILKTSSQFQSNYERAFGVKI